VFAWKQTVFVNLMRTRAIVPRRAKARREQTLGTRARVRKCAARQGRTRGDVQERARAEARARQGTRAGVRESVRASVHALSGRRARPLFAKSAVLSGLPSLAAEPAGRPPPAGSFGRCAAGLEPRRARGVVCRVRVLKVAREVQPLRQVWSALVHFCSYQSHPHRPMLSCRLSRQLWLV
jgi:hypothetical protein